MYFQRPVYTQLQLLSDADTQCAVGLLGTDRLCTETSFRSFLTLTKGNMYSLIMYTYILMVYKQLPFSIVGENDKTPLAMQKFCLFIIFY